MSDVQRQIILDAKNTFSPLCGQRLLAHLQLFCGGHVNQDNFDADSAARTAYNLGKNRVYRHLLSLIECDLGTVAGQDCIMEPREEIKP